VERLSGLARAVGDASKRLALRGFFGGIHTRRGRKAHAFWCKVQGCDAGVNPGITAMAH
jgi:hypothetical protein